MMTAVGSDTRVQTTIEADRKASIPVQSDVPVKKQLKTKTELNYEYKEHRLICGESYSEDMKKKLSQNRRRSFRKCELLISAK